jgi:hypothetical protein
MWIRSQDRKILTEIHNLDIDDINQIWDCSSLLGKYSSEEKANERRYRGGEESWHRGSAVAKKK